MRRAIDGHAVAAQDNPRSEGLAMMFPGLICIVVALTWALHHYGYNYIIRWAALIGGAIGGFILFVLVVGLFFEGLMQVISGDRRSETDFGPN
jgi:hypothetical protein